MNATAERYVIENMFRIVDKEGNDVDFILNPAQARLDAELTGRDIVPKARQEGITSYILARFAVKCLTSRNTRAVVISHDTESTQRMLAKVKYYLKNIKGPAPIMGNENKNELTFPKTNSTFYIGTAGSRKFGRGDTITHLHCSEVAFWADPNSLLSGLFQSVPKTGEIYLESTGKGVGNYYHRTCMRAAEGQSRFTLHFFNWLEFPDYSLDLTDDQAEAILDNLMEEWEESQLVEEFGLTAGQLAWRRMKLEELDYDLRSFKQEYPCTLEECFQASGDSFFYTVRSRRIDEWKKVDTNLHMLTGHPRPGVTYALGADVGGGVKKDNSVIQIIDVNSMEQVAEWASNRIPPDAFAEKIAWLGEMFNLAMAAVEANNHGILTLKMLKGMYPIGRILRGEKTDNILDLGFRTSVSTKPLLIGTLKRDLAACLTVHSPMLLGELSTFIEKDTGKLEADDGCMDDRVIAIALANYIAPKALMMGPGNKTTYLPSKAIDPFSIEAIIKEMTSRSAGFPVRSGVEETV